MELIKNGVPIAEIAAELGYATSKIFYTVFKRKMGVTPRKWLIDNSITKSTATRVSEAQEFLLTGKYTVKAAAKLVGFNSSHALTLAFMRIHGISAKHWLRQAIANKPLSEEHYNNSDARIEWATMPLRGRRSR